MRRALGLGFMAAAHTSKPAAVSVVFGLGSTLRARSAGRGRRADRPNDAFVGLTLGAAVNEEDAV